MENTHLALYKYWLQQGTAASNGGEIILRLTPTSHSGNKLPMRTSNQAGRIWTREKPGWNGLHGKTRKLECYCPVWMLGNRNEMLLADRLALCTLWLLSTVLGLKKTKNKFPSRIDLSPHIWWIKSRSPTNWTGWRRAAQLLLVVVDGWWGAPLWANTRTTISTSCQTRSFIQ